MKKNFCSECGNIVNGENGRCEFCGKELFPLKSKRPLKVCSECGSLVSYDKELGYICNFCSCDLNEKETEKEIERSI